MNENRVLFRTVHGSHLYGLAKETSDEDYYEVVDRGNKPGRGGTAHYARQTIRGAVDTTVVDFGTWMRMCSDGVPQALEAMFSCMAEVDEIHDFRISFSVTTGAVERYLRTITSFAFEQTYKHKRHALRLALNVHDLQMNGRFNPTLNSEQADFVNKMADKDSDSVYAKAMSIALDDYYVR